MHGLILGSSLSSKTGWCRAQSTIKGSASPALHIFMTHVFLNIYPFCMCILLLYIFTKLLLLHVHALVYVHHCCLHLHAHSSLCPLREVGAALHLLTCISLSSKRGGAAKASPSFMSFALLFYFLCLWKLTSPSLHLKNSFYI